MTLLEMLVFVLMKQEYCLDTRIFLFGGGKKWKKIYIFILVKNKIGGTYCSLVKNERDQSCIWTNFFDQINPFFSVFLLVNIVFNMANFYCLTVDEPWFPD